MAMLADAANVSQGGKLNVLGVFERINAPSFPVKHLTMVFVFRLQADWEDSGETYPIRVRLVDEDGRISFNAEGDVEVPEIPPGEYRSTNHIFNLVGTEFSDAGRYKFVIRVADQVHETRFTVAEAS